MTYDTKRDKIIVVMKPQNPSEHYWFLVLNGLKLDIDYKLSIEYKKTKFDPALPVKAWIKFSEPNTKSEVMIFMT